uniref:Uncharacterized protein n=1 Tax=Arundo donax TaxID=35708 RepID=A0A0A8YYK2_ARUDO
MYSPEEACQREKEKQPHIILVEEATKHQYFIVSEIKAT